MSFGFHYLASKSLALLICVLQFTLTSLILHESAVKEDVTLIICWPNFPDEPMTLQINKKVHVRPGKI